MNRGEIRKKADLLLGLLHADNSTDFDNCVALQKALDNVNIIGIKMLSIQLKKNTNN